MITSIAFTAYPVSNMERARAFYKHVLGLHVSHNYKDVWVEYDIAGSTFAITTSEMGHAPGAKGAVVAFEVSDIDAFVLKMKERAVSRGPESDLHPGLTRSHDLIPAKTHQ